MFEMIRTLASMLACKALDLRTVEQVRQAQEAAARSWREQLSQRDEELERLRALVPARPRGQRELRQGESLVACTREGCEQPIGSPCICTCGTDKGKVARRIHPERVMAAITFEMAAGHLAGEPVVETTTSADEPVKTSDAPAADLGQ